MVRVSLLHVSLLGASCTSAAQQRSSFVSGDSLDNMLWLSEAISHQILPLGFRFGKLLDSYFIASWSLNNWSLRHRFVHFSCCYFPFLNNNKLAWERLSPLRYDTILLHQVIYHVVCVIMRSSTKEPKLNSIQERHVSLARKSQLSDMRFFYSKSRCDFPRSNCLRSAIIEFGFKMLHALRSKTWKQHNR